MATTTDLLLAEAVQQEPRVHLDETQLIDYINGKWRFAMNPELDFAFNESYAPAVQDHVLRCLEQPRCKDYTKELLSEAISGHRLPPLQKRVARVFGHEAYAIAKRCRKKVSFVDGNGKVTRVSVEAARELMGQNPAMGEQEQAVKMVFVDVRAD